MAKDITLLGASYEDVPAVELPQTGGGTATFTDVSDTTATAPDVMEGTYFYTAQGQRVEGELSGGNGRVIIRDTTDSHGGTIRAITSDEELYIDSLEVTENGTYTAPTGTAYDTVEVDVQASLTLQSKSATPTESAQTITADSGYDGLSQVSVGAISSTYVGTGITRRSSSDLTASGATVTVPSGYYASQVTKAVASGSVTGPTGVLNSTNPSLNVGENTIYLLGYVDTTPTVTAGYVSGATSSTALARLGVSNPTKSAATITPGTTDQTIASGTYLTGAQTIVGDANLVASNIKKDVSIFNVTGTYEVPKSTHTATIIRTGVNDSRGGLYCYVTKGSTTYLTAGDTFQFVEGDTIGATISIYSSGTLVYMLNGEPVYTKSGAYNNYTYTMPDYDVEITLRQVWTNDYGSINIAKVDDSCKFIATTTYSVNTTSTTAISVGTFETGDSSIWTSDKMVLVKIRRLSGRLNGYYYGSDCIFANNILGNGLTATESYLMFGTSYYQNSAGYLLNYNLQRTTSSAAVNGYGVYASHIHDDGSIEIAARYDYSHTGTINGTFVVDVYLLDWPGNVSPFKG